MTQTFDWSGDAIRSTMRPKDRFTVYNIKKAFENTAFRDAVHIDPASDTFASSILDNRYSVVWQKSDTETDTVIRVLFVVPVQHGNATPQELKVKIGKMLSAETYGHCTLENSTKPPTVKKPLRLKF